MLQPCCDCGQQVSSDARKCTHCGCLYADRQELVVPQESHVQRREMESLVTVGCRTLTLNLPYRPQEAMARSMHSWH